MSRLFIDDNGKIVTLYELMKDFETSDEYDSFGSYLSACMEHNNGNLRELSADEKRLVEVTEIYYVPGRFGDIQKQKNPYTVYLAEVLFAADNADEITYMNGANCVVFNTDDRRIVQIGGFSFNRGLYCDLY